MTNEEIREKITSLENRKSRLTKKLDELIESRECLGKDGLEKETTLRKKIQATENEISDLEEKLNEKKGLSTGKKLAITLGTIGLCGILGTFIGKSIKKNCSPVEQSMPDKSISATATPEVTPVTVTVSNPTATPTVVPTAAPTATPTVAPTATPTVAPTATPVPYVLVDVTDDENVKRTAEKIYNDDVKPMLESIGGEGLDLFFTPEAIEDIIRVVNGELPKYSNYDDNTLVTTINLMQNIFANPGNKNDLYPMDLSKLFPEGSKEATYIKTYDDIYRAIAKYRAEGNGDGVVEQAGLLMSKVYNEWHLAGLYGGWNPYLFPAQERYILLQMCLGRYANYVDEWMIANDLVYCIPTCRDVKNNEYQLTAGKDVYEATFMGTSKNGKISVWRNGEVVNLFAETFADAKEYFDTKASTHVRKLD